MLNLYSIAKATAAANEIIRSRSAPSDKKKYLMPIDSEPASIEFNSVTFTYPDRGVPVLRDVSFKIKQGQFAAFVGASGSGKSTIISLMEGYVNDVQK
jgi:ABC-type multidrug transport system fused ATPase/permease subunit